MKMGQRTVILAVVALLLFTQRAQAYYTNFLDLASNALTGAYVTLTNNPNATRAEKQTAARIKLALKDLSRPSTSVAGDYSLFFAVALHLGPVAFTPEFAPLGSNIFSAFTNEAQAEIIAAGNRIAALNNFVRVKRGASNQVVQAQNALNSIPTLTSPQLALIVARLVYGKIVVANRLAAIGEAHPGFAAESVTGGELEYHPRGESGGTLHFEDATSYRQTEGTEEELGTYTYTRTGLNTATLVLTHDDGGTLEEITVKLRFTSATGGTFTARSVDGAASGSFTISD